ncbi:sec14 cytosolic factor [Pyrrhoderma noxium]|uniref:Sec14 cytosolic factor n=1 Tax=Pyrrhoderma noxium TaxID=2282107 RepID=A0A286UM74_9AGAM|nr:sec14 cytosolic factor [Pyrrhoderma noxium]
MAHSPSTPDFTKDGSQTPPPLGIHGDTEMELMGLANALYNLGTTVVNDATRERSASKPGEPAASKPVGQKVNEVISHLANIESLAEKMDTMIPMQILQDIDNARNPMFLTKERIERAATENQFMNGKIQALESYRSILDNSISLQLSDQSEQSDTTCLSLRFLLPPTRPTFYRATSMADQQSSLTSSTHQIPAGHLGNLTEGQQTTLNTLKELLQKDGLFVPERMDDATLLRFLRARKWDIALAKQMILEAENWRKEMNVDDIVKNFKFEEKAQVDKYYPQFYHKQDKEHRPLYVERIGQINITELRKITTQERQIKSLILEYEKFINERLPACSKEAGYRVETSCTILDLKNVGIKSFWDVKNYVQEASKIGQNYYPETMGKFYIINSPWMFSTVWNVIKGWLDPVTVAKIKIPSGDGRKELLEQIPAENLPAEFGGTCRCPGGCSLSDAGPWNTKTVANPSLGE